MSVYEILGSYTYAFPWSIKYDREQSLPFKDNSYNVAFECDHTSPVYRLYLQTQYDDKGHLGLHCRIEFRGYNSDYVYTARCFTTFSFIHTNKKTVGKLISPSQIPMEDESAYNCDIVEVNCEVTVPDCYLENINSFLRCDNTILVLTEIRTITNEENVYLFMLTENDVFKDMEDFETLLNNKELCDVKLISSDGLEFQAHKAILAARSPIFTSNFVHNMKEKCENKIEMKDVDSSVLEAGLKFIYTGKFEGLTDMASELLYFADKYDIKKLKMKCEDELSQILNVNNCVPILILADRHTSENLKSKVMVFIKNNISAVVKTDEYNDMKSYPDLLNEIVLELAKK